MLEGASASSPANFLKTIPGCGCGAEPALCGNGGFRFAAPTLPLGNRAFFSQPAYQFLKPLIFGINMMKLQ